MPYQIEDGDGRCLYRGDDLELACEIHDQVVSARLVILRRPPFTGPTRRDRQQGQGERLGSGIYAASGVATRRRTVAEG